MTKYKYDREGGIFTLTVFLCGLVSLWGTSKPQSFSSPVDVAFLILWGSFAMFFAGPFLFFGFVREKVQSSSRTGN